MASSDLTLEQIYNYFKENGNVVKNRELVHHFKHYLTDPASKEDARIKFKKFVNTLAQTKTEGDEKFLILKTRYQNSLDYPRSSHSPQTDPRLALGIPLSPDCSPAKSPAHRQPPPYRPPPPVTSPTNSLDNISLSSIMSLQDVTPQAPPRRKQKAFDEDSTPRQIHTQEEEKQTPVSVKERMEKFNRMASMEDELSPRQAKSAEKKREKGSEEDDGASVTSLEPKKCMEWYVTASKGDIQELLKLAQDEPRLVNRKDPFTYTVLHWGAKHGNPKIIQMFAGKYKVDVNGKTNGGYTPLHLAAQFGHKEIYDMLINEYHADSRIRDYSGRLPAYYLESRDQKIRKDNIRKIKGRKKPTDKDLGFLRIGSLNVRVKKTTEAFSNFLGVGSGSVNALETTSEKVHKGWGSADNVNQENINPGPKITTVKKKSKRPYSSGMNSTPGTPRQMSRNFSNFYTNDSDSDSAAGFDSQWKH
ncbi:ankyrin repeat domain-containing protein SOWAHC isoform X1 [Tribolium madens]|uniref:ankyrin repeat domain-containing protein SOWAHC isoform X1 n=1 Tax=Tribolium madens TaxID=41895 RepID=UPI001CF73D76|nr:ankyrin repeat domain-containing protein SOWAHC isoform X1 [Tribolium madens]